MPICNGVFQIEPCPEEDATPERDRLREIGASASGLRIFEDEFGGTFALLPGSTAPTRLPGGYANLVRNEIDASVSSGAGPTLSPNTAATLAENARQFDIGREDQLAQDERDAAEFLQLLAQNKFEFDTTTASVDERFYAEMDAAAERNRIEDARAATNFEFLKRQQEFNVASDNRAAKQSAEIAIQNINLSRARIANEQQQITNQVAQYNAEKRQAADTFNAQMEFAIGNENQRRKESNRAEIRATAVDIAEFSKNPGDVGKISAYLRAGGLAGLTEAAQAGEVGFTEESLTPLQLLLTNQRELAKGPELATYDPISAAQTTAPQFGAIPEAPSIGDLYQPISFDSSGLEQPAPAASNVFAQPAATGGQQAPAQPAAAAKPPSQLAVAPSGDIEGDLAEFDRRIAASGIDPAAAADMRRTLQKQTEAKAPLVLDVGQSFADGGTTTSNIFRVGEAGPELVVRNPDDSMTVIPEDEIPGAATGGTFQDAASPLVSAQETNIFQRNVLSDAMRRGGFATLADAAPIKVSAPGTSSYLQELSQGVFGAAGLGDKRTFAEQLEQLQAAGVQAGTTRRTA